MDRTSGGRTISSPQEATMRHAQRRSTASSPAGHQSIDGCGDPDLLDEAGRYAAAFLLNLNPVAATETTDPFDNRTTTYTVMAPLSIEDHRVSVEIVAHYSATNGSPVLCSGALVAIQCYAAPGRDPNAIAFCGEEMAGEVQSDDGRYLWIGGSSEAWLLVVDEAGYFHEGSLAGLRFYRP
jgi:hypothetical protein